MKPKNLLSLILCSLITVSLLFSNVSFAQVSTSCWALNINANDPAWPGFKNYNIRNSAKMSDGFVICGTVKEAIFPSKNGNSIGRTTTGGPFLAKYDFNGNLIWLDYGHDSTYASYSRWSTIHAVTTDSNDNIYVCGTSFRSTYRFYYANGTKSVKISTADTTKQYNFGGNFIAKMNKQGDVLWHTTLSDMPEHITYNNKGQVIVASQMQYNNSYYYCKTDTVNTFNTLLGSGEEYASLYWIDTLDGQLKKKTNIKFKRTNTVGVYNIAADKDGTLYINGGFEHAITLYTPGKTDSLYRPNKTVGQYGDRFFLAKIDTAGVPQWLVCDIMKSHGSGSTPGKINIAPNGELFIASSMDEFLSMDTFLFYNNDSSFVQLKSVPGMLYAISKNGYLKWYCSGGARSITDATLVDTNIVMVGITYTSSLYPYTIDTVFSAGKTSYMVNRHVNPNIGFSVFDTTGVIRKVGKIGTSNCPNLYDGLKLMTANAQSVILYSDYSRYACTDSTLFYRDTVKANGYDGFVLKYTLGVCDTVNAPAPVPSVAIMEPFTDTLHCQKDTFYLPITVVDSFNKINAFQAELSNGLGYFSSTSPTILGYAGNKTATSIKCVIPVGTTPGNKYRIRVMSSSPALASQPTVYNLTIGTVSSATATITAIPSNAISMGTTVVFRSVVTNAGITPYYQWQINGVDVPGANADTFVTTTLMNNDAVRLRMHSSIVCAKPDTVSSLAIVMKVSSAANNLSLTSEHVMLYPNPAHTNCILRVSGVEGDNVVVVVEDVTGRCISQYRYVVVGGSLQVQLMPDKDFEPGVYIVRIKTANAEVMKKLIISK